MRTWHGKGESIIDFALTFDMAINTFTNHVTYSCGGRQTDFAVCRRTYLTEVKKKKKIGSLKERA